MPKPQTLDPNTNPYIPFKGGGKSNIRGRGLFSICLGSLEEIMLKLFMEDL